MLEAQRHDAELAGPRWRRRCLGLVRAVVRADAGVVAAHDEVGAAVVLAADRVPHRLARAAVAHRGREGREQHAVLRVVAVEQRAVAVDAHRGRDVVALRLADQRVDQQAVDDLERGLGDVLVRPVDRVAGLEAGHAAPAALGEDPPGVDGIERQLGERRRRAVEDLTSPARYTSG